MQEEIFIRLEVVAHKQKGQLYLGNNDESYIHEDEQIRSKITP